MGGTVRFAGQAVQDLQDMFDYLHPVAGERIARDHVAKLYAYCLSFETFPERGTRRDDLRPGLRFVGYRRQATIAFVVTGNGITILRVFARGRDVEALIADEGY
ncbi:type II toxin-antitoxin system RelE/ParE family toxin [Bosea caraganae]|uniref:Type II toxin-antitoxin system RelE/ParE family toxin n=1 Tax=Bosea caraganae TaxID=2763117 RepID=A0A370L1Y7_9HYPH|nr:type II toxin-antitoxin system RelE/ParE family toxin [Bosea caraganae]RDJ22114.1 type II toxin-antitoxin system RelE/ParE family toxin [Bosea caraganae]RDJ22799.1 type II toxin-antitoxin system RelE/ParE family toxin [Bosea caraganae]